MIEIESLYFKYPGNDFYALRNFNLSINAGELIGLVGQNGAGKTTLIKCICSLLKPTSCEEFSIVPTKDNQKNNIGLILSIDQLYNDLTALENINFYLKLNKVKKSNSEIQQVLNEVGLAGKEKTMAGDYSTGMKQKLNIARVLLCDSDLLILDEPTSGMDPLSRLEIYNLIKAINIKYRKTIIVSTHIMEDIEKLCERVVMINKGAKIIDSNVKQLFENFQSVVTEIICSNETSVNLISTIQTKMHYSSVVNSALTKIVIFEDNENMISLRNDCVSYATRRLSFEDIFFYHVLKTDVLESDA